MSIRMPSVLVPNRSLCKVEPSTPLCARRSGIRIEAAGAFTVATSYTITVRRARTHLHRDSTRGRSMRSLVNTPWQIVAWKGDVINHRSTTARGASFGTLSLPNLHRHVISLLHCRCASDVIARSYFSNQVARMYQPGGSVVAQMLRIIKIPSVVLRYIPPLYSDGRLRALQVAAACCCLPGTRQQGHHAFSPLRGCVGGIGERCNQCGSTYSMFIYLASH